ncbi:MAG TPA: FUSC family protein [Terriglobales bacterium]|nr:FUSC family protein [Terriglobales bacterium]
MALAKTLREEERNSLLHIGRTTLAAIFSQVVAHALRMPEPYWATVTTIVVMQSTLGAAWQVSVKRFAGTALGAVIAGLLVTYAGSSVVVFALAIFGTGLICLALGLDRTAYRFAGITEVIIMLVARDRSAWVIAAHRFVEVSLGIAVALALTAVWPERLPASPVGEAKQ